MTHPDPRIATGYFGIDVPFMKLLGLQPVSLADDKAITRLPARDDLCNSRGDVHGGVLMSVLDFTISAAARSHDPIGIGVATIDMSTHFLAPARGELTFEGTVLQVGRSTAFSEGTVTNAGGQRVCVARATFRLIRRDKDGSSNGEP